MANESTALEVLEADLLEEEQREIEKERPARVAFEESVQKAVDQLMRVAVLFASIALGVVVLALIGFMTLMWWWFGDLLTFIFREYRLGALLLATLVAAFLFRVRSFRPMLYGALEVSVGLITAYYAFMQFAPTLQNALPIAAAIYIMVRGLDNFSKGVRPNMKAHDIWQWMFFPPK